MELVVLGSGTLLPTQGRASAGFALKAGEEWIQMDLGRGVLQRMCEEGLEPLSLRHLLLSHIHPDHCCDLVPLLFARNYCSRVSGGEISCTAMELFGPAGFGEFFGRLVEAWRWLEGESPLQIHESTGGALQMGSFAVEAIALEHGKTPNLGFRVQTQGKTVAYTGDTGPCDALLSLADRVDILISECALADERASDVHLSPAPLARAAAQAGVRKLVVTHVYPEADPEGIHEALRRDFGGEIFMAHDGLRIEA